jgi:chromosome segregation ATPase
MYQVDIPRSVGEESKADVDRLKNDVRGSAEDHDTQARSHSASVERMNTERRADVITYRRQASTGLEERVRFYETRDDRLQQEVESRGRTIAKLKQELDRNVYSSQQPSGTGNDQGLRDVIAQLQEKLRKTEEAYRTESEAREAKYTTLLGEQHALVRHLQAELDEMVNLMPVDQGSSRMIDDDDMWIEEKSREISRFYDGGLDQIITELHGTGESVDFENAADEAETSLRQAAEEAGLEEPLDKATLAAFGIRQLRTEYILIKRLLIESEGRVKDLMQANNELTRRGEHVKENIAALEGEKEAIKRTVTEAEERTKRHLAELEAVKVKLVEAEKRFGQLALEKGELGKKNRETEDRLKMAEGDKTTLQRLVNDTKRLNEILKTQYAEEEARARDFEEEILGLRRQLAEERAHVGVVETETLALRQQIVELEENLAAFENSRQGLESKVKKMVDLEKEKKSLEAKIEELESNEEADTLNRQLQEMEEKLKLINEQQYISKETIEHLRQSLFNNEQASRKLANEKEGLRNEVEKAAAECRASRGRFAQLLHDTAEKEAKWATSKQYLEAQIHRQTSVLELIFTEVHDATILDEMNGNQAAMLIEVLKHRRQQALDAEEKAKRYKGAAKKWLNDYEKSKAQVEALTSEIRELKLNLKAEKKSSDEKMGQLILALRRE